MGDISQEHISQILADVKPENYFYTKDSQIIKNLAELLASLPNMSEDTYNHHVNSYKNDFSNWIRAIIGDKELADSILNADKESMIKQLDKRLHQLTILHEKEKSTAEKKISGSELPAQKEPKKKTGLFKIHHKIFGRFKKQKNIESDAGKGDDKANAANAGQIAAEAHSEGWQKKFHEEQQLLLKKMEEVLQKEKEIEKKEKIIAEIEKNIEQKLALPEHKKIFNKEVFEGIVIGILITVIIVVVYVRYLKDMIF